MALFCVSCALICIAALGILDAVLPDDDFWTKLMGDDR